nr:hypothetical protein [Nocardia sp. 348MFTsu5.1]
MEAVTAALLHDVIEDSEFTASDLVDRGIPATVVAAVELLTRHKDVPDTDYYAAIVNDPVALAVKLADLADNTDPARLGLLDEAMQVKLITKYTKAFRALGRVDLAAELASRRRQAFRRLVTLRSEWTRCRRSGHWLPVDDGAVVRVPCRLG